MLFRSTRDPRNQADFKTTIFKGLASDGGLYFPLSQPDLSLLYSSLTADTPFNEMASQITFQLLKDEISASQAETICNHAFSFLPKITQLSPRLSVLELYHGPSAAFKDFGASFLAAAMEAFLQKEQSQAIILTATSGDTGSAVARAFYRKKNIDVLILYPSGRVSPLQEKQLTTLGGNIHALEVHGSFDDCQHLVKSAFTHPRLSTRFRLTSANSINVGRLLPQSFYYTWAWARLKAQYGERNLLFTVPSGNFGNLTACVFAKTWGMQCGPLLAATNRNKVVPDFLESGIYSPRPSVFTPSNAMDVGAPSNFERLLQLYPDAAAMRQAITAYWFDDEATLNEIKSVYERYRYFVCPHTAVGLLASEAWLQAHPDSPVHAVSLSTAHPAKFTEIVQQATGIVPPLPPQLADVQNKPKQATPIDNTLDDLEAFLNAHF